MTPNFEYYKVFYYAAKYGNFTLAAKVLLTSQPSVTRSIKSLEHSLGCKLFVRSTRGVDLTPEGKLLYSYIADAYVSIQRGEEALHSVLNKQHGPVYIGATETAIRCFLLEQLGQLHEQFAHIGLKITSSSTPKILTDLKAGKIDLAVVTTPIEEEDRLLVSRVRGFQDVLAGGDKFCHLAKRKLQLVDLQRYPLISLAEETMTSRLYAGFYAQHGLQLQPDIVLETADLLLPMIQKNLGIGFVPSPLIEEACRRGEVFALHLQEKLPQRFICVVQDRQHPLSSAARRLFQVLRVPGQKT